MKTKIFAFETLGVWILATARIVSGKCYVNYCYADNVQEVALGDLLRVRVAEDIELWCEQNDAILWAY